MSHRYSNTEKIKYENTGKVYYVNTIYPDIPLSENDQYLITTNRDRLDLLAYDIYKDTSLWWVIASANNLPGDSLVPPVGMQLRIPANIQAIVNKFNSVNTIR
jgi:hypothetical protein